MNMITFENKGQFLLAHKVIDSCVLKGSIGNCVLGDLENGKFIVRRVGRSDTDIYSFLMNYIGVYVYFSFSYADSVRNAYRQDCEIFHYYSGVSSLDNEVHPVRPKNTQWRCPICSV